jgi:hypothetical protein
MDESTTTNEPVDTGVQETQPADTDTQAAENQPAEPTTTDDSQEAATPVDDNLAWLQNKGIDPQSPEALAKVAEMYRNAEKLMHESTAKKTELQAELQPSQEEMDQYQDDPTAQLNARLQAIEMERGVERFFNSNPDAKQYEDKMVEMVNTDPKLKILVNNGYLNVENLYQMAKGADSSREQALKSDGGREALQKVADKQQARAVTPAASSSQMSTQGPTRANVNEWYAGLTSAQRESPETQATLASLLS